MPKKSNSQSAENAKGAAQGVVEGAISSVDVTGQGSSGGGSGNIGGKGQAPSLDSNRVVNDAKKLKQLGKNVKDGNLQRGLKTKIKQTAKNARSHPIKNSLNPTGNTGGLDREDTKNVAKGITQGAMGNEVGLAETVVDEANHISEAGQKDKEENSLKSSLSTNDNKDGDKNKSDSKPSKSDSGATGGGGSLGSSKDDKGGKEEKDSKKSKKSEKASDDKASDQDGDGKDAEEEEKEKKKKNLKKAHMASVGAGAAVKGFMALQFAALLKTMLSLLMAAAQALATAVAAVVAAAVHAAATVAVALGVSMAVAVGGIFGVIAVGIVAVAAYTTSSSEDTGAAREGFLEDENPCILSDKAGTMSPSDISGNMEENMQKVYSFFKNYGYPDEQIAGILGNWQAESGVDPTSMETYGGIEAYTMGENKTRAYNSLGHNNDFMNEVCQSYINSGWKISGDGPIPDDSSQWDSNPKHSISASGYYGNTTKSGTRLYYPGIGLGQFTGGRAYNLVVLGEKTANYNWYDIELQLAYIVSTDSKATWIADWAGKTYDKPETACRDFLDGGGTDQVESGWEGITPGSDNIAFRQNNAAAAYVKFAEWTADTNLYDTIMEIAGDAAVDASVDGTSQQIDAGCTSDTVSAGTTLAERMSQYCLDTRDEGIKSYQDALRSASDTSQAPAGIVCGSKLYQKVHANIEAIRGADNYWASCDRGVGYAILWSGCDDDLDMSGCDSLITHFTSCDHWSNVTSSISSEADLKPGDICIRSDHVIMYLGEEAVLKYHEGKSDPGAVYGQASHGERAPCVQSDSYADYTYIFRNVKQDANSPYKNAHR